MLVRLRDSYVTAAGPITLDVNVGQGQRGYVEVTLNGTLIASGSGITALAVGGGPSLAGKRLRVTATVTDTNANTNRTDVTYRLTGGAAPQSWTSSHDVVSEGDTVDYDAIFVLL